MINDYDVQKTTQPPRFPKNGKAREVDDLTELCDVWAKNDGCRLDQHFYFDNQTQGFSSYVTSHNMFAFMQKTCMKSCGWAPEGSPITITTLRPFDFAHWLKKPDMGQKVRPKI